MKAMTLLMIATALALLPASASMRAIGGENHPAVQSALGGRYYVRTVPDSDFGSEGSTKVFKVERGGDKLLDEYPVYMRGELYLRWSPNGGKWCLVHLEPERITNDDELRRKLGTVSRLVFYVGGKRVLADTGKDLEKMGLEKHVQTLVHKQPGQFLVHGICQIPRTSHYVLKIDKITQAGKAPETFLLDITTGKIFNPEPEHLSQIP